MTSFKLYVNRGEAHTHIRVFAGPDEQHRAFVGRLSFKPDEAQDFLMRFTHDAVENDPQEGEGR